MVRSLDRTRELFMVDKEEALPIVVQVSLQVRSDVLLLVEEGKDRQIRAIRRV